MDFGCPGKIAGFGIPLLDFIAEVDHEFLTKYRLDSNNSTQAAEDQRGLFDELARTPGVQVIPGGAVPNAIRTAQWLLGVPHSTISFGCIGDDHFGRLLTSRSESEGVCVQYEVHPTQATGTCAVLITGQDRCLLANFGAAKHMSHDFIQKPESWDLIQTASVLYIVGYFIHTYPAIAKHLANFSSRHNRILAVNLSAVYVCQQSTRDIADIIKHADYVFGNETEFQAMASALHLDEAEELEAMMKLSNLSRVSGNKTRHVIITHGRGPTAWCDGKSIKTFEVDHIPEGEVVDTCGAGDAFVGGFLSQLVQGRTIEDGIRCGHYAAGLSVRQRGITISGKPDFR